MLCTLVSHCIHTEPLRDCAAVLRCRVQCRYEEGSFWCGKFTEAPALQPQLDGKPRMWAMMVRLRVGCALTHHSLTHTHYPDPTHTILLLLFSPSAPT